MTGRMGRRIIELGPPQGFSAETAAWSVPLTSAYAFAMPVSASQVISNSIMGVGAPNGCPPYAGR